MRRSLAALALAVVLPLPCLAPAAALANVVVRPGETLSEIADRHGVSLTRLMQANGITNPNLVVAGQKLVLPGARSTAAASAGARSGSITVQPGETLSEIADRQGVSITRLMQANGITNPNVVVAGQKLVMPGARNTASAAAPRPLPTAPYTIKSGETLSEIADRFGTSTERQVNPDQQSLFDEAETEADLESPDEEADVVLVAAHTKKKPGRKPLPAHLPRVEVRHDLADADKVCACGNPLHCIGEDVSEQLDIIPEEVYVIRNIRPKYACRQCDEGGVRTAPIPTQIIPRSNVTPGLLAYVATGKYVDGLPLYRMEKTFDRFGLELPRRTLANWMIHLATILDPLLEQMKRQQLQSHVLLMDETRVQVLDEPNSQSYMWVTVSGGADPPVVCYSYESSRGSSVPIKMLEDFTGVLVTDGYAGYNAVGRSNQVVHAGCMAHVRRKFDEALKVHGKQRTGRAQMALTKIRKLYAIEAKIKSYPPDERKKVRQTEARPIMAELRIWLDQCLQDVAPKTALGKALNYMHREWKRLLPYLDDGHIPIDNNRCENAIRPFVIGRKAWLFSKSTKGANASATIYSIIESAKANNLEPYHYLRYILTEIAAGNRDYESMLPYSVDPGRLAIRRVG